MPASQSPPDFRTWVERERDWGLAALGAVDRTRRQVLEEKHGLDRFSVRMGLVELTGAVAAWSHNLRAGFEKHGDAPEAAEFAAPPPFADTDPSAADCDRLSDYVEARRRQLADWLADDAGPSPQDRQDDR